MPTKTENAILARRRAESSGDVLVPILERLLEHEVIPEDEQDFRFLDMLVRARALPRRKGVFSPSMLSSCSRQVWFAKRDVERHRAADAQMNGYFLHGNFIHFKWQFAMWKAHRAGMLELARVPIEHEWEIVDELRADNKIGRDDAVAWKASLNFWHDKTRPGVEVRVVDGDYGGTIDVLAHITNQATSYNTHVIDFKGVRLDDYMKTVKKGAKPEYRKQIVGYAKIANKVLGLGITDCLLVSECKAGPVSGVGSPIALHETRVNVADFEAEVDRRLRTLRWYDFKDQVPAAECVSTNHMSFQSCPFNRFCLSEVKEVQKEREKLARQRYTPKKPARSRRES